MSAVAKATILSQLADDQKSLRCLARLRYRHKLAHTRHIEHERVVRQAKQLPVRSHVPPLAITGAHLAGARDLALRQGVQER